MASAGLLGPKPCRGQNENRIWNRSPGMIPGLYPSPTLALAHLPWSHWSRFPSSMGESCPQKSCEISWNLSWKPLRNEPYLVWNKVLSFFSSFPLIVRPIYGTNPLHELIPELSQSPAWIQLWLWLFCSVLEMIPIPGGFRNQANLSLHVNSTVCPQNWPIFQPPPFPSMRTYLIEVTTTIFFARYFVVGKIRAQQEQEYVLHISWKIMELQRMNGFVLPSIPQDVGNKRTSDTIFTTSQLNKQLRHTRMLLSTCSQKFSEGNLKFGIPKPLAHCIHNQNKKRFGLKMA